MRVRFSDSEQWSSPVKPPRSQNYVKPHDARTRVHIDRCGYWPVPGSPVLGAPVLKQQQHAAFPLPEGEVSLSFPAQLSVASAQNMASFVNLLLKQIEQQAKILESKKDEAAN